MGRDRPCSGCSLLVIAAVLTAVGCAPRNPSADLLGTIGHPLHVEGTERVDTASVDSSAAALRLRDVPGPATPREDSGPPAMPEEGSLHAGGTAMSSIPAAPPAAPLPFPNGVATAPPKGPTQIRPAAVPQSAGSADQAPQPTGLPSETASGAATGAPIAGGTDPRLLDAQRRIAGLERQLAAEVRRREEVEAEMKRLLQETSAGPFEHADDVLAEHLREQLDRAKREIAGLRKTVNEERRARDNFERRYAALLAQVQAAASAPNQAPASEEIEALKERQRRVLASIQQDLEASKRREAALRETLQDSMPGDHGAGLADALSGLRAENSALQLRLDEEHRRNTDLTAKLQLATRVTDLIFRMQAAGTQPVAAAVPLAP
jgi:hypothetical protein